MLMTDAGTPVERLAAGTITDTVCRGKKKKNKKN